jgi:hypothetical protein
VAKTALQAPTGVLDPSMLYLGDNGRCFCGTLECAGMTAFFSGRALDGFPVVAVPEAAKAEPADVDLRIFACEGCGMKLCPACGSAMQKVTDGAIGEWVLTPYGKKEWHVRPGVYHACSGCEHCEEVTRG